ncbi:hypothetical protein MKY20_24355 [Cytobacillus sp. FSL W8-0315]|uniref:hypothetical protein n=1 Tax=Cytobacillus sp. FSL W8-0315 TaxID=2921600 RepID=UPI000312F3AF
MTYGNASGAGTRLKMFNPTFIRALVYAGLLSCSLAILVCTVFREWERIPFQSLNLAIWSVVFIIHRQRGTW